MRCILTWLLTLAVWLAPMGLAPSAVGQDSRGGAGCDCAPPGSASACCCSSPAPDANPSSLPALPPDSGRTFPSPLEAPRRIPIFLGTAHLVPCRHGEPGPRLEPTAIPVFRRDCAILD